MIEFGMLLPAICAVSGATSAAALGAAAHEVQRMVRHDSRALDRRQLGALLREAIPVADDVPERLDVLLKELA